MEKKIKNITLVVNLALFIYLMFIGWNRFLHNMTYIRTISFVIINSIFIYSYGILTNTEQEYKKNINIYLMMYLLLLISVTFYIGRPSPRFRLYFRMGQLEPFYTITSQLKYGSTYEILKNVVYNSIMLIPLSFLLMIKSKNFNNPLKQTVIILPLIILIEIIQSCTFVGAFDVDDIILNYLGAIIFTLLITRFNLIDKIRTLFYKDFKLNITIKKTIFYICLTILLIFDILIIGW